jgi:hypothetical protein
MKLQTSVIAITSALALANCTGSTDPTTATVFDNFKNIQSGEYDRQIAGKEAEARSIINANNASQGRLTGMERSRAANSAAISNLRGQISGARAEVARARVKNPGASAQLAGLDRQLVAVQRDVESGGDAGVARAELGRIRSAVRALSG